MLRVRCLLVVLAAAAVLTGCTPHVPKASTKATAGTAAVPSQGAPGAIAGTIKIVAADLSFSPSMVTVAEAGTYKVELDNTGAIEHNITFSDGTVVTAAAGAKASGEVNVPAEG